MMHYNMHTIVYCRCMLRAAAYDEHVFIIRLEPRGREWERHVADLTWGNCGEVLQGLNIRILSLGSIIDQNW